MASFRKSGLPILVVITLALFSSALSGGPAHAADPTEHAAKAGVEEPEKRVPKGPLEIPVPAPPAGAARAQSARRPAQVWSVGTLQSIQVNVDALGNDIINDAANEPSIAIDPGNPQRIVIGWRQFATISDNFRQAGVAYSHDLGQSWTATTLTPNQFRSDPVLAADNNGNFFYSSLPNLSSVEVFKSVDGGVSWLPPVSAFGGDKQWMTVDRTGGIGSGFIYQNWNSQFSCCASDDFTRSTDGGVSFTEIYQIPSPSLKWGTLDVDPDGTLYVAGSDLDQTGHVVAKSTNVNDNSIAPSWDFVKSVSLGGTTETGGPNPGGMLGQVWVATDHSSGPNRGNVYILASVNPPGSDPLDVMFIRSTDGGATFSEPVRVNDDPPGENAYQWFGTMSVAPNGRIDVIYYDTQADPTTTVRYTASFDAGRTWSPSIPVSQPFDRSLGYPNQDKMGDYVQMISDDRGAGLAYAATFNGGEDVYFLRIERDNNNTPDFYLYTAPTKVSVCAGADAAFTVNVGQFAGFTDPVTLGTTGTPAGATTNFSVNPVTPPGSSLLTIGTGAIAGGAYSFDVTGTSTTPTKSTTVNLTVFTAAPSTATLTAPANDASNVAVQPVFTWTGGAQSETFTIEVATDAAFSNIVASASGLVSPTWTSNVTLSTGSTYFWRVRPDNSCGTGGDSAIFRFLTAGGCAAGSIANVLYTYGFEAGPSGWTHSGTGDSWEIAATNPHAGASHFHANDPDGIADQQLVSPAVVLPVNENPIVLTFWHVPNLEADGATRCWDGGILEVSTDAGAAWTQVPNASLLAGPYRGLVRSDSSNPLGGLQAWCGATSYFQTIADVSAYAGQTVQFRFRLGSDMSFGLSGWNVDDVTVQSCAPDPCAGVVCSAIDQCHVAGVCDPATGRCSDPPAGDGTVCDDGNACTAPDTCAAGACVPGNNTCTNGVFLNEVHYDQASGEQEFIELLATTGPIDLTGWTISDQDEMTYVLGRPANPTFPCVGPFSLNAGDRLVVWQGAGTAVCTGTVRQIFLNRGTFLQRDGDDVVLRNGAGACKDYVAFENGPSVNPVPAGCSWTGPNPNNGDTAGRSISRFDVPFTNTHRGADWERSGTTSTKGPKTPGAVNVSPAVIRCATNGDCNDNNPCTTDVCQNPGTTQSACVRTNNTLPCNDGDTCTSQDRCSGGICAGGPNVCACRSNSDCSDGNPCTDGECQNPGTPQAVCVQRNNTAPCDDANACTGPDTCSNGACVAGPNVCAASVVVSEVHYDQASGEQEFIELYATGGTTDLTGWSISDVDEMTYRLGRPANPSFPCPGTAFSLNAGDRLVIYQGAGTSVCTGASRKIYLNRGTFLQAAGDDVVLRNAAGACRDYVAFETGPSVSSPVPAGCAWAGPNPGNGNTSGRSISRFDVPLVDTNRGADWERSGATTTIGTKTPGTRNTRP